MKKRLPLILVALAVVLLLALPFAVWAANTPVEQFDLELGRTYWFDLSESGIPGTVNDKLPDQTLHYVPFTYAGTVSAYTLLQAAIPTESEMEYEHSLFISEYNITHTVSWNELNKKDLIFRNLTEYNGVPYYIHAPSGGARYDTGPFNNEWQRIFEKNSECYQGVPRRTFRRRLRFLFVPSGQSDQDDSIPSGSGNRACLRNGVPAELHESRYPEPERRQCRREYR